MNKPEALRLAQALRNRQECEDDAADELLRLHALNSELLEALKLAQQIIGHPDDAHSKLIAAAIAKAEGK
jgi:hypothetical protein